MRDRRLVVVCAGLSQPSSSRLLADRLAATTRDELLRLDIQAEPEFVDVRNHAHDVMNHLLTGFPAADLRRVIDSVAAADGLIAVTPIFNASYSGLFKSFFDVLEGTALTDKPVLIAATGGTARHSLALEHALRPLFSYLRAVVVPTSVYAASEDWAATRGRQGQATEDTSEPEGTAGAPGDGPLHDRIRLAARELAVQMGLREPVVVTDPFALPASFEDLIAGP